VTPLTGEVISAVGTLLSTLTVKVSTADGDAVADTPGVGIVAATTVMVATTDNPKKPSILLCVFFILYTLFMFNIYFGLAVPLHTGAIPRRYQT
jgi:hypothetical protein